MLKAFIVGSIVCVFEIFEKKKEGGSDFSHKKGGVGKIGGGYLCFTGKT